MLEIGSIIYLRVKGVKNGLIKQLTLDNTDQEKKKVRVNFLGQRKKVCKIHALKTMLVYSKMTFLMV